MSTDTDIVSAHPGLVRSRLRTANFGNRYLGLTLSHPEVARVLSAMRPSDAVGVWMQAVRDGRIVRAQGHFATCGKGLWITGPHSAAVACAMVQELIITNSVVSALYVRTEDYLQSERPEGERQYRDRAMSEVLILSGYGSERRTESGWAESTLDNLVASRFDAGLPTVVCSHLKPPSSMCGYLGNELFYGAAIMETTREED